MYIGIPRFVPYSYLKWSIRDFILCEFFPCTEPTPEDSTWGESYTVCSPPVSFTITGAPPHPPFLRCRLVFEREHIPSPRLLFLTKAVIPFISFKIVSTISR